MLQFQNDTARKKLGRRRAAILVYRRSRGRIEFLLISRRRRDGALVLPGGRIDAHERPDLAARREAAEEAGVEVRVEQFVGEYLHAKRDGRQIPTAVFLGRAVGRCDAAEDRRVHWLTADELMREGHRLPSGLLDLVAASHRAARRHRVA